MPAEIQETFVTLLQKAWRNAWETRRRIELVDNSVPVLFFGRASTARVATVGLNPSSREFSMSFGSSNKRFYVPSPEYTDQELPSEEALRALQGMHWYFHVTPYVDWFSYLEAFVWGLGASFTNGTAVHTDVVSPFATVKPYGRLSSEERNVLLEFGVDCWRRVLQQMPELKAIAGMGSSWKILSDRFGVEFNDVDVPFEKFGGVLAESLPRPKVATWEICGRRLQVYWWQRFWKRPFRKPEHNDQFLSTLPTFYCELGSALWMHRPWARQEKDALPSVSSSSASITSPRYIGCPPLAGNSEPVQASETALLRRLTRDPADGKALHALLVLYDQANRQVEVVDTIERYMPEYSDSDKRAYLRLLQGCAEEKRHHYFQAEQYYTLGIREKPTDPETTYFLHNNLGFCRNELGLFESAETPCRAALRINTGMPNAWKNLGISLRGQDDWVGAAWCFLEALKFMPRYAGASRLLRELLDQHPYLLDQDRQLGDALERFSARFRRASAGSGRTRNEREPNGEHSGRRVVRRFHSANELAAGFLDHFESHPDATCLDNEVAGVQVWARGCLVINGERVGIRVNADTTRAAAVRFCRAVLQGQPQLVLGTTRGGTGKVLLGTLEQSTGLHLYVDPHMNCDDGVT